jgi:cysteinyl-tRNA synthetase
MSGEKMSKSLGNLAFVGDLLERHPPAALRAFLLRRHYRQDWSFDEAELSSGGGDARRKEAGGAATPFDAERARAAFFEALDQDLDTPAALRILDLAVGSGSATGEALADELRSLLGLVP